MCLLCLIEQLEVEDGTLGQMGQCFWRSYRGAGHFEDEAKS